MVLLQTLQHFSAPLQLAMSSLARAGCSKWASAATNTLASSSRASASQVRRYATDPQEQTSSGGNQYGTVTDNRDQGAIIKRWKGPGIPMINVCSSLISDLWGKVLILVIQSLWNRVSVHHPHLWKGQPLRALTEAKRKTGGRDQTGTIVVRHIGGGHKRRLRTIDFYRFLPGVHDVIRIEYDPGRSGHIALLKRRDASTADVSPEEGAILAEVPELRTTKLPADSEGVVKGGWSYILAPEGLRAGDTVRSFRAGVPSGIVEGWEQVMDEDDILDTNPSGPQSVEDPSLRLGITPRALGLFRTDIIRPGNVLPLYLLPPGTQIHNITLNPLSKMRLCRSAGSYAEVVTHQNDKGDTMGGLDVLKIGGKMGADGAVSKHKGWSIIRMSSGEIRKIVPGAVATIGRVSK